MVNFKEMSDGVYTLENLFTQQECEEWIELSEKLGFEPAPIHGESGPVRRADIRNNARVLFDDATKSSEVWHRLTVDFPSVVEGWVPIGLNERMRFYRYDIGETFKWHADGIHRRDNGQKSFLTFLIYLNDDFAGGETVFRGGLRIEPRVGMGLLFVHWLKHMGAAVTGGRKYVLRSDVMYQRSP